MPMACGERISIGFKKRKLAPKVYDFETFGSAGYPIRPSGVFRDNIREFLRECAETDGNSVRGNPTWCTLLEYRSSNDHVVPLHTIVEDVKRSPEPYCDHCRCAGWGNHLISKRNYHLIIPAIDEWKKPLADNSIYLKTNLLHGLLHGNGFGHLLCINGIAAGSKYLRGRELMDLWDRICTNLQTRKITVRDFSRKRSMDLRLLYGVGYGHSWYGRWGYKMCRGSFGVTKHDYYGAIELLRLLELDEIAEDFSDTDKCREMRQIIRHYRNMSETQLTTLGDLLRYILIIKSHTAVHGNKKAVNVPSTRIMLQINSLVKEKSAGSKSLATLIANMDTRWPAKRLEYAAEVIVNALKENKADGSCHGGMTRQDLRDAARAHIGDTGLLDYVLKSLNNIVVGSYVVCRTMNPRTRTLVYTLRDLCEGVKASEPQRKVFPEAPPVPALVPGDDVNDDLIYLYNNLLLGYPPLHPVHEATETVLKSKCFIKEWADSDEKDQFITFSCQLMSSCGAVETDLKTLLAPSSVVVPVDATIGELKRAVGTALRDTYYSTENFFVIDIEELGGLEDEKSVCGVIAPGQQLNVIGRGLALDSRLRSQAGVDSLTIRCRCGSQDNDGERMVECRVCNVWQHTYCCGIEDTDTIPPCFICRGCYFSTMLSELKADSSYCEEYEITFLPPAESVELL